MGNILSNNIESLIKYEPLSVENSSLVYYIDRSRPQNQVGVTEVNFATGVKLKKCFGSLNLHSFYISEMVRITFFFYKIMDKINS